MGILLVFQGIKTRVLNLRVFVMLTILNLKLLLS